MIIDELIAVLGYEIRGVENLNKFNASMNEAEAKARAAMTAINELGGKLDSVAASISALRTGWKNLGTTLATEMSPATAALNTTAESAKTVSGHIETARSGWKRMMADMRSFISFSVIGSVYGHTMEGLTEGIRSSAEYQREKERQRNAGLSPADMSTIEKTATQTNAEHPAIGFVNAMEMMRTARVLTGEMGRAAEVMPDFAKAYIAILNAKGDAAPDQLTKLFRAIEDAGKNTPDLKGVQDVREILNGVVKATQVEGSLLNPGDLWQFIRRAKNAGTGVDTSFISNVAPIFMQQMSASSFGTGLSSLYQNFQLGMAKKEALKEQERLGLRVDDPNRPGKTTLIDPKLFGGDLNAWVKKYYIPALLKQGINLTDKQAVGKESGLLASNPNGAFILTSMATQQRQVDKFLSQYGQAKGLDAADTIAGGDPFVAWRGFIESLKTLATAVKGMPEAVAGLNALTGGIERFAAALHNQSGPAQAALAGGGILGLLGAFKAGKGLWDLATAGTSLQAAAASLEEAAISLGAGGKAGAVESAAKKGWFGTAAGFVASRLPLLSALLLGGDDPQSKYSSAPSDAQAAMRAHARSSYDLQQKAIEEQGRYDYMNGLTKAPTRAKDVQNTPGISALMANMAKVNGGAQTVINDSSNRSVTVQANIALTVQQVAQAASQAAAATAKAVTGALGGVNPARTTPGPSF
jgi:hypothetical protein